MPCAAAAVAVTFHPIKCIVRTNMYDVRCTMLNENIKFIFLLGRTGTCLVGPHFLNVKDDLSLFLSDLPFWILFSIATNDQ